MTVSSIHPVNMRAEKECTHKEKQYLLYMKSLKRTKAQQSIRLNDSVYIYGNWNVHGKIECSLHFISLIVKNKLWRKQLLEYKGLLKFISPGYCSSSWRKSRQDCKHSFVFTVTWQTQPRTETNKYVQIDAFMCIQCRALWVGWFFSHHLRQLCFKVP